MADGMMWRKFLVLALLPLLSACEEEQVLVEAPVRAIKSLVVTQRAGEQVRRIAGIIEANLVTDIAFEVSGRILGLKAEVGDRIDVGTFIARLDPEPYLLKIQSIQAQLNEAEARLKDAAAKFAQQSTLFKKGFATQTSFDTARANLDSATSSVNLTKSSLELAKRDFKKTDLIVPVAGQISEKYVERFAEIKAGQKIVQISSDGQLKIRATVPESMVQRLKIGDGVDVIFPTIMEERDGTMVPQSGTGRIIEIAGSAGAASSYPVTVRLTSEHPDAKPGMTVEVSFKFTTTVTGTAFLLPISAVLPTAEKNSGAIFVFDEQEKIVRRRNIKVINVRDNELEVVGDIEAGDIVAIAGVSFLVDNMKVSLLDTKQAR